jgi:ABC-type amino acid transport substrate-binding protein
MRETFSFERGKIDQILSDLASLVLYFKDLRDKDRIEEDILERIITIYEQLHMAVVNSRIDNDKLGKP